MAYIVSSIVEVYQKWKILRYRKGNVNASDGRGLENCIESWKDLVELGLIRFLISIICFLFCKCVLQNFYNP